MDKTTLNKRELEVWQEQLFQLKSTIEKKEMELERREQLIKERESFLIKREEELHRKENELQGNTFPIPTTLTEDITNEKTTTPPFKTNTIPPQINIIEHQPESSQVVPPIIDMSFFNAGLKQQRYQNNVQQQNDMMFTSTPINRNSQQIHSNPYMPQHFYQPHSPQYQQNNSYFDVYDSFNQQLNMSSPQQQLITQSNQIAPHQSFMQPIISSTQIPNQPPQQQENKQKEFEIQTNIPIPDDVKINELEFEEMKLLSSTNQCNELEEQELQQIEQEMEKEKRDNELLKQELQQEVVQSTPTISKQNYLNDSFECTDSGYNNKVNTTTRAALSLFGTTKVVEEKLNRYQEPKKIETKESQGSTNIQKKKTRFTLTGQPICSYPGCSKTTSINPDDFCCCSVCKIAYCEQHKNKLEIIIPTFKNLTSKRQIIKPYVVCEDCKIQEDNSLDKQEIGVIINKWDVFEQKRKMVIGPMKEDEERVKKGLEHLIGRIQKGKLFGRKENGKNNICPVCDVLMNGADYMNVTCDICMRKCCVGCSIHTTIAPTLIMGIEDPMAEYIKVVICKKCYNCTRRKTNDTRVELKKRDQTLNNAHQKLIESEAMLKSLLKRLEDVVDNFKGVDDIKLFEQKEMFYVDGLNDVTNILTQLKSQKDNLDKDMKSIMNNLVIAYSSLIQNSSMKHAVIFSRYTTKVKQLNLK
ncbi:hypothetical protein ENUP19_0047G0069 [Entamoeba nuttalli]|uniref:Uncharacterized protein n=2 Tax=Entamoeba nuttalli TaxID=412467 RepID=K2H776_ENTNP|nr:hypothetical protein ENU1_021760 [Entamoeba nuttalli P19]EKE42417.1 hypothetical protein ENU1_021760 [Entamoeba nuttalli P19]|eukprot:XP_008855234.1 hypothetical protein ENU1_021760 [Entamoeba nuttalli P19]